MWLILLAVAALCGFDLYMARLNESFLWELLAVFALQLAAMVMTFAFPLMARYENTWRNHLKNAMLVAVGHLPRMLLIWLIWAVPVGIQQPQLCDGPAAAAGIPQPGRKRIQIIKNSGSIASGVSFIQAVLFLSFYTVRITAAGS